MVIGIAVFVNRTVLDGFAGEVRSNVVVSFSSTANWSVFPEEERAVMSTIEVLDGNE